MNKTEIKQVVDEIRKNISYPDIDISPLSGCGLSDFPLKKMIRKEVIVMHLRWQCINLNGSIDEVALSESVELLKDKKVIMI